MVAKASSASSVSPLADREKSDPAVTIHVEDVSEKSDDGEKGKEKGGGDEAVMQGGVGVVPPTTGYAMAQIMSANRDKDMEIGEYC